MKSRTRKRLVALLVVGVLAAGGVIALKAAKNAGKARAAEEKLAEGLALYEQGQYAESIEPLNYAVSAGNRDPGVMLKFADARRKTPQENNRHLTHAMTIAKDVATREDPPGEAHEMLLDLYTRLGQAPELAETAADILAHDPDHLQAGVLRTQSLLQLNRVDEAIEVAEDMAERHPTETDALAMLFEALRVGERPDDELLARARELTENENAPARSLLLAGQTMLRLSGSPVESADNDEPLIVEASEILETVLDSLASEDTQTAELTIGLCDIASRKLAEWAGRQSLTDEQRAALPDPGERAEAFVNDSLEADENPELRSFAIHRRWKQGRLAEAIAALVSATSPPDQGRTSDLGLLLVSVRDPNSPIASMPEGFADQLESELSERKNESVEAARWLELAGGVASSAQGAFVASREAFAGVETGAEGIQQEIARFLHAQGLLRAGESAVGLQKLGQLAGDPAWRRARYLLARISLDNGDSATAVSVMLNDPAIRNWPEGVALVTKAAIMQAESPGATAGSLRVALDLSQTYLDVLGQTPRAMAMRGRALAANGQTSEAIEIATSLLEMSPGEASEDVRVFADRLESIDGGLAEQLRVHAVTNAASPFSAIAKRIESLINDGKLDTAERELELTGKPATPSERLGLELARALIARERGEPGATETLFAIAERHPESAEAQLALLNTPGAWQQLDNIERTIDRLRAITGSSGAMWKVHSAALRLERDDSTSKASKALIDLEEVLRIDPTNRQALVVAARAADLLDDRAASTEYLARALDASPGRPDVYPALITSLLQQQRTIEAAELAEDFASLTIRDTKLLRRRAELLEALGLRAPALADRRVLAKQGLAEDRIALATLLANAGEFDAALEEAGRVEISELSQMQIAGLARAQASAGDPDGAVRTLSALPGLSELGPRDAVIAQLLLETGHTNRGTQAALDAARASEDATQWLIAVRALIQQGRPTEAGSIARQGTGVVDQSDDLRAIARALTREDYTRQDVIASSALTMASTSQTDGASELAAILRPLLAGDLPSREAAGKLERFIGEYPRWYPARFALTSVYEELGRDGEAARAARDAVQALPGNPRVAADATRLLLRLGRFEEAVPTARKWKELTGRDSFEPDIHLAAAISALGRSREAIDLFTPHHDRLLENHQAYRPAVEQYLASLAATGGFGKVDDVFAAVEDDSVDWGLTMVRLASIVPVSQSAVARSWIEQADGNLSTTPRGRFLLASAWNALGNRTGEPEDYRRSAQVPEDDDELPGTYAAAAASTSSLGDLEAATDWYAKAYAADGTDPLLLNNYAYHLVLTERDAAAATRLAEQAVEAARQQDLSGAVLKEFLDTLGLAQLQSGQASAAVETFREAVRIDPFASHLSLGLAEALSAADNPSEAKIVLESIPADRLPPSLRVRHTSLAERLGDPE